MKEIKNSLTKLLCPPGNGVFTVHTGRDKKLSYQKELFQTTDEKQIETKWSASLKKIKSEPKTLLLGICSDTGGGILRGANWDSKTFWI